MNTQQYVHIDSGKVFAIPARGVVTVAGQQIGPYTSEAALLALGCMGYAPPPLAPVPSDAELLATQYAALRADHVAGFAYFQAQFRATATALAMEGITLPDPLTFRGLLDLLGLLPGDQWTRLAFVLRGAYDEVLIACDMQTAERVLPALLNDETLAEGETL